MKALKNYKRTFMWSKKSTMEQYDNLRSKYYIQTNILENSS